jgi:acyl-CoA thioesterase
VPEQTPTFTQHFASRWTIGQAPFSWAREAELGGWCRFREDQGLADEEIVLALVDAWPAPVLPLLREPAPASSVTWPVGLFEVDATARADDWWFFHGQTAGAADGHAHSTGMLWTPSGAAAAVSQQLVAVFD